MNKLQILVVEDDAPVRNLITTTLKTHDYRYIVAANGEEAIRQASTCNPDIVLLDLGLPDIDGVEVIKNIRSWSNMPIIVISARSEDGDKTTAPTTTLQSRSRLRNCLPDCALPSEGLRLRAKARRSLCSQTESLKSITRRVALS